MLSLSCFSKEMSIQILISIIFAEEVLHIYEEMYPEDLAPRESIDLSRRWLSENVDHNSISVAYKNVENSYESCVPGFAKDAVDVAAYAIYDISCGSNDHYSASAATHSAFSSMCKSENGNAFSHSKHDFIHSVLIKHLDKIFQFHIKEKASLRNPEEVFQWLSEKAKKDFIFQMDILC